MATVPVTRVWVAGEVVTDAYMNNNLSAVLNFLLARPMVQVRQTVAQSLPDSTATSITFDAEDFDTSGMHSTVSNTNRLTAVYPGYYSPWGGPGFANNSTGRRLALLRVNGTNINGSSGNFGALNVTKVPCMPSRVYLNVSDWIDLQAYQSSGVALNTAVTGADQSIFGADWVSN